MRRYFLLLRLLHIFDNCKFHYLILHEQMNLHYFLCLILWFHNYQNPLLDSILYPVTSSSGSDTSHERNIEDVEIGYASRPVGLLGASLELDEDPDKIK